MSDSRSNPEHHVGRSFLRDIPLSTKRYRYQGKEHFLRTRDLEFDRFQRSKHDTSQYILFDIDADTLKRDFLDPHIEDNSFTFDSFNTEENLLLIKMETQEHAQAIQEFGYTIMRQLDDMRLRDVIQKFSTKVEADSQGKVPDNGWGPTRPNSDRDRRPTIVLEVGVSESQPKLEADTTFWLDPERGNANIVLTLKLNRKRAQITLDKYEWDKANGEINRVQRIQMTKGGKTKRKITVSKAPLIIPFEQLLERPISSPVEKDIIIKESELRTIARSIWNVQRK
ncbi:hypothetical protein N7519_006162 [Penicillium mononematosum]|uniref:uncharacterized protein n=1 Tax=Penicillium mononematosum TaxID=268346 RepID=UPI002547F2A3|nr:uncharacterized protein N7519_006162 [Penicillium mononematosum]KAJ6184861.1 hypothetical protein N7519_006162 [Penicillium mononematosum]